jgi:hypothetical protein
LAVTAEDSARYALAFSRFLRRDDPFTEKPLGYTDQILLAKRLERKARRLQIEFEQAQARWSLLFEMVLLAKRCLPSRDTVQSASLMENDAVIPCKVAIVDPKTGERLEYTPEKWQEKTAEIEALFRAIAAMRSGGGR